MAEYGEWNRKGATISDVTAKKEYGVDREFIIKGIRAGKLEYRQGLMWGNPYLRILRTQLEKYISEEFKLKSHVFSREIDPARRSRLIQHETQPGFYCLQALGVGSYFKNLFFECKMTF